MALKISKNKRYLARLVTGERAPCAFCLREVDDEVTYGKLYAIGDIQCHYFCCLLSCCLIQKGSDEEGLFGFMYPDILAEIERCKKHKCSYCGRSGANLGCSVSACRKQFHVPCGRSRNAVSLYYGSYKSFCQQHAPKQKIPEHIMAKARLRMRADRSKSKQTSAVEIKQKPDDESTEEMLCLICYESVEGFPSVNTFWPPCCGKDAWFHRTCLQRMALSAGMHYLKCPLCNDKENFHDALVEQGYYVPDRDAAWELEQNAFAEIYERAAACGAERCLCAAGRAHDADTGDWDIKLCLLCGSAGAHARCLLAAQAQADEGRVEWGSERLDRSENINNAAQKLSVENVSRNDSSSVELFNSELETKASSNESDASPEKSFASLRFVCKTCLPAAPEDLNALASSIEAIIQEEQAATASEARRPLMPSRMSIRRTKGRLINRPSTSRSSIRAEANNESTASPTTVSSRLELPPPSGVTDNKLMSPIKLLEQSFKEKMVCAGVRDAVLDESVVDSLRRKIRKPRPMCERKRIIDNILDRIFDDLVKNPKQKEQVKEWCSPKKCTFEDIKEIKYKSSEFAEVIETSRNKENDSNTFNTTGKDPVSIKIENVVSIKVDNVESNGVEFKNSDDYTVVEATEDTIEPHIFSKNVENIQLETEIKYISNKSNEEKNELERNCSSVKRTNISNEKFDESGQNNLKDTRSKSLDEKETRDCIKPKTKSNSNDDENNKNSLSNETQSNIEVIPTKQFIGVDKINPESIVFNDSGNFKIGMSVTNTLKERSDSTEAIIPDNRKQSSKKFLKLKNDSDKKSLRSIGKSKRVKNSKPKQKVRSKSESSTDINILKRLLTEKDLCSQLLRELTTGETGDTAKNLSGVECQKVVDPQNNSTETSKSVNNTTDSLHETINDNNDSERETPKLSEFTKPSNNNLNNLGTTPKSAKSTKKSIKDSKFLNIPAEIKQKSLTTIDLNKTEDLNNTVNRPSQNPNVSNECLNTQEIPISVQTQIFTDSPTNLVAMSKLIDVPKHKTIDILQDSSLEISENDQHINIDVIKIEDSPTTEDLYKKIKMKLPNQSETCLKFSPTEEIFEKTDIGVDLESFKKEYLSEVDREFQCNFKHKHVKEGVIERRRFRSPIDFAIEAVVKKADEANATSKKRKISENGTQSKNNFGKRRKVSESDLKRLRYDRDKKSSDNLKDVDKTPVESNKSTKKSDREMRRRKKAKERRKMRKIRRKSEDKNIEVTIGSSEKGNNKKKKIKTKFAIRNENIQVKIKWKKKQLRLNIESKKDTKREKKVKETHSKFKQYILQFSEGTSKEVLVKPEKEVCPLKRTYVKKEKSPDKLKQMSIQSFFKIKSEN